MKEYILSIEFENWTNQLWFMNNDNQETKEKWNIACQNIESLRTISKNPMEFQNNVIEYLANLGFIRVQK